MEIRPDVHLLATRMANSYLIIEEDGLTLVDALTPNQRDLVLNYLERIGYRPEAVKYILVTHADYDHVGSLADLQEATRARVIAGAETAAFVIEGNQPQHLPRGMQWIAGRFMRYRPVQEAAVQVVAPGEVLPILGGMQAIATPGHTPDHMAYYSAHAGVLFAGDALKTSGGKLGMSSPLITADVAAARQSGRELLNLAPALIACGHGPPSQSHTLEDVMGFLQTLKEK